MRTQFNYSIHLEEAARPGQHAAVVHVVMSLNLESNLPLEITDAVLVTNITTQSFLRLRMNDCAHVFNFSLASPINYHEESQASAKLHISFRILLRG